MVRPTCLALQENSMTETRLFWTCIKRKWW